MQTILNVFHLFLAIGLVGLVLIQHGKGADAGAAFGSGASATVFGARGSGNFLSRATAILAALFFLTSMALAYFASQSGEPEGLMEGVETPVIPAPVAIEVPQGVPVVPETSGGGSATDVPVPPQPAALVENPSQASLPEAAESEAAPALAPELPVPAEASEDVPVAPEPDAQQGGN
jgi:preprotein translocase subunit SecG